MTSEVNMKKSRKTILSICAVVIGIILIYSYFHVSGRQIKYLENISDDTCTVMIRQYQFDEFDQRKEYVLDTAQIEQLKKLISESSFTRVLASTVQFHDHDWFEIRVEFGNRQNFLGIYCIGNEYITVVEQFNNKHLKIKNPNWKASLEEIITA